MQIREARTEDLPAILTIHNQVIADTTAIYEDEPATLGERRDWFAQRQAQGMPVLVATVEGAVAGFSSFGSWRARVGYRHTVEHTVHVHAAHRRQGIGQRLLEALFPRASQMGLHVMVGHIDAAMTASLALHDKLGFERIGTYRQVAVKFGRWLDLVAVQRLVG